MNDRPIADKDAPIFEWGVEWDDMTIAYATEEHARYEQAYPTRPDRANPRLVRRTVGEWEPVIASADPEPQPTDGPDYHADHAAWTARQTAPIASDGSGS